MVLPSTATAQLLTTNCATRHEVVNKVEGYVSGQIHTNGLENFWSLLKRGLGGML
jgi:hypothetical protein